MNADPIVVAGGGYAGFWAAMAARRIAGPEQPIRMVSRDPILQMRPRLYEAAPETLGIDLRPLLDRTGIDFQAGEATAIADNTLVLSTGERIPYARLVVATGSQLRRPPIPGADRAYSIATQSDAIAFDRRLAEIARTTAAPRLAVIGAGFTGIELALELRDRLALYSDAVLGERLEILLVDAAPELGPELGKLASVAESELAVLSVIRCETSGVTADQASLPEPPWAISSPWMRLTRLPDESVRSKI